MMIMLKMMMMMDDNNSNDEDTFRRSCDAFYFHLCYQKSIQGFHNYLKAENKDLM